MSIKTKLILISVIPLVGLMMGVVLIFLMVKHTNREIEMTQTQYATGIEIARRMQFNVIEIQQYLTDFSATRGQDGLDDGIKEAEKFRADFQDCLEKLTVLANSLREADDLSALSAISREFGNYWENGVKMANVYAKEGTTAGNQFMPNFDKAAEGLTGKLEPFIRTKQQQFDDALNNVKAANSRVANLLITGGLLTLAVALGFCVWVGRSISSSILRSVVSMHANIVMTSAVARRISESSEVLADGASTQAASVEKTSSSLEEISSMTTRNSEDAQRANSLAKETRVVAERGVQDMQEMNTAMETIKVSSDEISEIIKTIDEIAFQTNILALNAAVEAARAGTAGMGFAVVADEVRNLAQRSAEAAKETTAKIEGAISNTSRGVELSGKVAQTFDEIVTKARELDGLAAELASASGEQALGITQINESVVLVDKVTQDNASSAQENATAAKDLTHQTSILREAIERLMEFLGENTKEGAFLNSKGKGVIQWNEKEMNTSVASIDEQHKELINLINAVHETVKKGKGGDQLMRQLNYLGEYAQNHFAHEEEIMDSHSCPIAGKNKEAHTKFLRQYQDLVQEAHTHGATPELAVAVQKMLGDWLTSHICKIDTNLRGCRPQKPLATSIRKR